MKKLSRHEHDCSGCTFLGHYKEYDLYWCPQGGHPTLIARYGTCGDYLSGLSFGWAPGDNTSPLVVARKLAQRKGLDVRQEQYDGKLKRHPSGMLYEECQQEQVDELFNCTKENNDYD